MSLFRVHARDGAPLGDFDDVVEAKQALDSLENAVGAHLTRVADGAMLAIRAASVYQAEGKVVRRAKAFRSHRQHP